ncbi:hypothetical protein ACDA63_14330 [Uliginosibacterium sp. sgz301328]|uniref:hypothetical protein n=1 Tax=Uliginosibacterium sp. sgz301328 TaxID=3243764 RepID=UPI00359EE526
MNRDDIDKEEMVSQSRFDNGRAGAIIAFSADLTQLAGAIQIRLKRVGDSC